MMMSDLRRDYFVTRLGSLESGAAEGIEAAFAAVEAQARAQFAAEGVAEDKVAFARFGKFRYQNQEHTVEVPLSPDPVTDADLSRIAEEFHAAYEREYTYRLDAPVEMVGLHVVARGEVGKLQLKERPLGPVDASPALKGRRPVDYALEGVHEAAIYDGTRLAPGMGFVGPAIIEDPGTTIVVHPGNDVRVDGYGNIRIALED
jgi:N-methylhydantoinase A